MKAKSKKIMIIKDSRESNSKIYRFQSPDFKDKVIIIRDNLYCGDFSLVKEDRNIFIERKTLGDLVGSFCGDRREQFKNMWERSMGIKHKFLLVEGNLSEAILGAYRSAFHPHSLIGSLMAWQLKYSFSFFFVANFVEGQHAVYYLLSNYVRLKKGG